ncbi:hypothetical protein Htur_2078 [Haloterrigena turkmenica DSM 5511]|uniref:DUF4386 family protein n=1 Tax=Haloterrigena turkmenica (strain ATCC 51198 / DSM 5511 / JCM 9101 / NCIMB 13204 / VKM B-1734 / 4k) TaxID=543526 RepID=D2RT81_HALTV|nr:hypothetical protein [Haloterrigena turkmenica]ADB60961.1 hypothetical protein Htur_2078 [Haloterrigena turkmenica DSM 5511]
MTAADETGLVPTESIPSSDTQLYRVGAVAAILGVAIQIGRQASDQFHPQSEPGNPPVAFADYAAHEYWVLAHLLEFLGFALIFGALLVLSWRMRVGRAAGWAVLGAAGTVMSLTLAAALQAIDGIALKLLVDRWAETSAESQELLFEGAYAVRQIEGAVLAMFVVGLGLTILVYGVALVIDDVAPNWLGMLGIAAGPLTVVLGVVLALDPFGEITGHSGSMGFLFGVGVLGNLLALLWIGLVGRYLFQSSRRQLTHPSEPRARSIEGDATQSGEIDDSV